jgi:4-diphosphocytidyl-2-C-methyl-D-erythritol kinase
MSGIIAPQRAPGLSGGLVSRAPAKINLTLHVLGRRADGYHELESLVVFAGVGDRLALLPDEPLSLTVEGPTAVASGPLDDNLVLRVARLFADRFPDARLGRFLLTKRLPVAAGIGGGSSDAAAALRLLSRLNGIDVAEPRVREAARLAGADISVCLEPGARMMRGIGEVLGPRLSLARLFAVLVNPGVPVPTAPVFRALALTAGERRDGPAHPDIGVGASAAMLLDALAPARNDLETPAVAIAPPVGEALAALRAAPGCRLARMSGSGGTVFGLFDDCDAAARAAKMIRRQQPGWWVKPTSLR